MMFEISGHKINHLEKADFLISVAHLHLFLPYFEKMHTKMPQCTKFVQILPVDSMENNSVLLTNSIILEHCAYLEATNLLNQNT